jgi:methylase of polypeptide subunit release factors
MSAPMYNPLAELPEHHFAECCMEIALRMAKQGKEEIAKDYYRLALEVLRENVEMQAAFERQNVEFLRAFEALRPSEVSL